MIDCWENQLHLQWYLNANYHQSHPIIITSRNLSAEQHLRFSFFPNGIVAAQISGVVFRLGNLSMICRRCLANINVTWTQNRAKTCQVRARVTECQLTNVDSLTIGWNSREPCCCPTAKMEKVPFRARRIICILIKAGAVGPDENSRKCVASPKGFIRCTNQAMICPRRLSNYYFVG